MRVLVDLNLSPAWVAAFSSLTAHTSVFESGALVTIDERNARVRVLPIR
jgi:hypothetical protein